MAFAVRIWFNPYADWVCEFAHSALKLPYDYWIDDYRVRKESFTEIVTVYSIIFAVFCFEKYKRRKHDFFL